MLRRGEAGTRGGICRIEMFGSGLVDVLKICTCTHTRCSIDVCLKWNQT
jgi:hypothetical protein